MIPILTCVEDDGAYTVWLTALPSVIVQVDSLDQAKDRILYALGALIDYGFETNSHFITDKEHMTDKTFLDEELSKSFDVKPKIRVKSIEVVGTPESDYKAIKEGSTDYTEKDLLRLIEHFTEKEEFEKCQYLKNLLK